MSAIPAIDLLTVVIFIGVFVSASAVAAVAGGLAGGRLQQRKRARLARFSVRSAETLSAELAATIRRREKMTKRQVMDDWLQQKLPRRQALAQRLARTGLKISLLRYVSVCLLIGAAVGILAGGLGLALPLAALVGLGAGAALPYGWVGVMIGRRTRKFLAQFPEAIDQIVRGVRSGLPVSEAIASIGRELPDPVSTEFQTVVDQVRLGRSLEEALWLTALRLGLPEFNFLVISMVVQRETGGNLAETLENLSDIIRKRQQMVQKARAMSSEARASALIVGSLPFVLGGILLMLNPDYMSKLFTDPRGHFLLGAALASEVTGFLVMTRMAKFEI